VHRCYSIEGFKSSTIKNLSEYDAKWFMRAIDDGLVVESKGDFLAPRSSAKEMIFWEGSKMKNPRPITLWIEPIITIEALARLNKEFGWPSSNLGTQSKTWEFDLACYSGALQKEHIVCEVKKTPKEIEKLLHFMQHYSAKEVQTIEPENATERNAYRKVQGIRKTWPILFWALGPNNDSHVFEIVRSEGSEMFSLLPLPEEALTYGKA
jgi:hypothetical protein